MKVHEVDFEEFFATIKDLQYQNQDIKEAWDMGYKDVQDAYDKANTNWARFYLVKHRRKVLSTILEQRDGNLIYFTTVDLPNANIRRYVKLMRKLSDDIIKCRDVLLVETISWYGNAQKFLKLVGFKPFHKKPKYWIWYKDNGK